MHLSSLKPTLMTPAALILLSTAPPALAQDAADDEFHPSVGIAGLYRPDFRGSKNHEFEPLPFVAFDYELLGRTLSMQGTDLTLDLFGVEGIQAGPVLGWRSGRDDAITNTVVRRLPQIDSALEGGGFISATRDTPYGRFGAGARILADLGGVDGGYTVTVDLSWAVPVGERLAYRLGANVIWADEEYMQTYYGVTTAGAAASGMVAYRAGSGVESVGFCASARYQLTDRWGIAALASYDRLLDQAADTPIVSEQGSENQARVGLAVYRVF